MPKKTNMPLLLKNWGLFRDCSFTNNTLLGKIVSLYFYQNNMGPECNVPVELSQSGVVENLVKEGRIPVHAYNLLPASNLLENGEPSDNKNLMLFLIPPIGSTIDDTIVGEAFSSFYFISPDGTDRGPAEMYVCPEDVGNEIRERIASALAHTNFLQPLPGQ